MMSQGRSFTLPAMLIILCALLLVLMGISGIQRGDELDTVGQFAPRQVFWLCVGLVSAALGWNISLTTLKNSSYWLFGIALWLLILVYFFPPKNGSRRWIPLGLFSMQPSELAKITYLMALGRYLMFRNNHRSLLGLIPPLLMTGIPVVLILREPDLGTALLFFPVLYAVLLTAGARKRHLLAGVCAGLLFLPVLWTMMSAEQKSRVTTVFLQQDGRRGFNTSDGYHLYQSKQMLALGGTWGSQIAGTPVGDPAAYQLPAGRTDFVFCLVGEAWGLPGTLGVMALFALLACGGLVVAAQTRDPYSRLVCTGIVTMMTSQALINTAMTVGLAPITGLTLPLMSYGGSSLVTIAFCLGLLLNVATRPAFDVAGQPFVFSAKSQAA